uniref:Uncharacterized protein n=1 Tax=Triticum urartu TaxID=4572 RepID=A0A8R7VF66_TRIUA
MTNRPHHFRTPHMKARSSSSRRADKNAAQAGSQSPLQNGKLLRCRTERTMATWLVPGAGARHGPHGPRGPREPPRRRRLAALEVDHGGPAALSFPPRRRQ